MSLALGRRQRILRQRQTPALKVFLQARLGVLDLLSWSQLHEHTLVQAKDDFAGSVKARVQSYCAKQRFEGIGQD